jgi:hypothetical protein
MDPSSSSSSKVSFSYERIDQTPSTLKCTRIDEVWVVAKEKLSHCIQCQTPTLNLCNKCKIVCYCSDKCKELDLKAHKIFCSKGILHLSKEEDLLPKIEAFVKENVSFNNRGFHVSIAGGAFCHFRLITNPQELDLPFANSLITFDAKLMLFHDGQLSPALIKTIQANYKDTPVLSELDVPDLSKLDISQLSTSDPSKLKIPSIKLNGLNLYGFAALIRPTKN